MCDMSGGVRTALAGLVFLALAQSARAQGISVSPVNVQMGAAQKASVLTIVNQGDREISFQIRAFGWQQDQAGGDRLTPTDELVASPPLATVAPGATQIVRLVLRASPQNREAPYRILLDQLTPPAETGRVHVALRLSIPVFAEPGGRLAPDVQWRIVNQDGRPWLVAVNKGSRHETFRDMALTSAGGARVKLVVKSPPHVLAGGTQRWLIETTPPAGTLLHLTASGDSGSIDRQVGP